MPFSMFLDKLALLQTRFRCLHVVDAIETTLLPLTTINKKQKGILNPSDEQIDAEIAAMRGVSGATSVAPREIEYPG